MDITTFNNFIDAVEKLSLIPNKGLCDTILHQVILNAYRSLQGITPTKIIDEIRHAAPDVTKIQKTFDYLKNKLNMIDIPDFDVYGVSLIYQGKTCREEACMMWEELLDKCAEVKRYLYEYAENENLQNNSPRNNFLSPRFCGEDETLWQVETARDNTNDIDSLKVYFKSSFCGLGNNNTNYFEEYLKPDLQRTKNKKELATIALLIYNSPKFNSSLEINTFKKWHTIFCKVLHQHPGKYKPAQLDTSKIKNYYYYLE